MPAETQAAGADAPGGAPAAATVPAPDQKAQFTAWLREAAPTLLEGALAPLRAELAAALPKPAPAAALSPADEAARRIAALESQVQATEAARIKERNDGIMERAHGELRTALGGKVRPDAVDVAAKFVFHADRAAQLGADGRVQWRLGDVPYASAAEFAAAWAQTPAANVFREAPGYGAARTRPGARPPARPPSPPPAGGAAQREDPLTKTMRELGEKLGW